MPSSGETFIALVGVLIDVIVAQSKPLKIESENAGE